LRKKWINTTVYYIRQKYITPVEGDQIAGRDTDRVQVDAIVGPDTKGVLFAFIAANKLKLPYIPIHKAGEIPADANDVIQAKYTNPKNKVNFS